VEGGRAICLGVLACFALGAIACAEDEDRRETRPTEPVVGQGLPPEVDHPVTTSIDRLQQALVDDDYAGVCAGMTHAAARHAGEAAHGDATTCEPDVRRLFGLIRKSGGWRQAGAPRVTDVAVDRADAMATVALDRRWRARVPLSRRDGRWRLSGFFGAPPSRAERVASSIADTGRTTRRRGRG
jgi:hypothetical protein